VLVLQVVGPHLEAMFNDDPTVVQQKIKSLAHQVALGTSFLHDCGIVHADLHKGNIAFSIPNLDGNPEERAMMTLGPPQCVPVFTRDQLHQNISHPKYLVLPGSLIERVNQDDMRVKIIDLGEAFFSTEVPQILHTPLQVRAPEVMFNHLSTLLKVEIGTRIDVWSVGCLIYELATSCPPTGSAHDEVKALRELTTLLGPLPEAWRGSLGVSCSSTGDTPLEQRVRSTSEVDDTPGVTTLLQCVLVLDPLRRPLVSDFLNHPWFADSSSPATPSGSASE